MREKSGQRRTMAEQVVNPAEQDAEARALRIDGMNEEATPRLASRPKNDRAEASLDRSVPGASPRLETAVRAVIRDRVRSIGLEPNAYGTHSIRRTKVSQIYRKTGILRAVQLFIAHMKMDSTVRYFSVEREGALAIAEVIEI